MRKNFLELEMMSNGDKSEWIFHKKEDRIMKYRLGCYNTDGSLECLRTVDNKESAKLAYKHLKEEYGCTIWVQKIEFVDPKEEFKEA